MPKNRTINFGHYKETLPVDLGLPAVKRVFTNGQCHSLAFALNKLTKWPIVGFGSKRYDDGDIYNIKHLAVKTPNEKILDITGVSTIQKMTKNYGSYRGEVVFNDGEATFGNKGLDITHMIEEEYCAPDVRSALVFARLLLIKIGEVK